MKLIRQGENVVIHPVRLALGHLVGPKDASCGITSHCSRFVGGEDP